MGRRLPINRTVDSFSHLESPVNVRETFLIWIATEGQNTEYHFFKNNVPESLKNRIKVLVLPTKDGKSAPEYVWNRLKEKIRNDQIQGNIDPADQYWIVVDVDQHAHLSDTLQAIEEYNKAEEKRVRSAVSNPCFEVWLALYGRKKIAQLKTAEEFLEAVRAIDDHFTKMSFNIDKFKKHEHAISQARELEGDISNSIPPVPGTRVYLLVEVILKEIEKYLRIIPQGESQSVFL